MTYLQKYLTLFLLKFLIGTIAKEDCKINLDSRTGNHQPFILKEKTNQVIYPKESRIITIGDGENIVIDCHGSKLSKATHYGIPSGLSKISLSCDDGAFRNSAKIVKVEILSCTSKVYPQLERKSVKCSPVGADDRLTDLDDLVLINVGFNFSSSYSPLMNICHDEKVYGTIWTHHTIRGESINNRDRTIDRPTFRTNIGRSKIYYPFTTMTQMNSQYSKSTQVKTIKKLLGIYTIMVDGKRVPIIDESRSGTHYFAKGHLSPDAAFIYSAEQDGTYFYSNVAPQFQSFNNRNWKSIESTARKWASDNKRNLEVYTGTASILKLPNKQSQPTEIKMFPSLKYVPAPMYYWKVLYDPEANEAIAFIGLNNPYERKAHNHICTNICAQTVFDDVDFYKFEAGYTMCCEVSQLRMSISSIPDLSKEGKWPELMGKLGPTPPPPTRNGCKILLDKLPEKNTPLITSNGSFLYPTYIKDEARITLVPQGSTVELNCHRSRGNFLLYKEERISKIKSVKLTCTNDKLYTERMEVNPADYKCSSKNQPSLIITRNSKCSPEGIDKRKTDLGRITHISLGWNFRSGFIEQVELCIDELFYGTLWTKHNVVGKSIEFSDKDSDRPAFIVDETGQKRLFGKRSTNKITQAYAKKSQKKTIKEITGHTTIYGLPMIETNRKGTLFMAKGHLSPDAAFVYDGEQEGTYFFVNAAPQYQSFNNGNWRALELAVRDLAEKLHSTLTVYTGTYEILEFYEKQIFLLEKKLIPAPRYFWKVVHDPSTKKAVAFVGYNNVFSKTSPKPICKDVCDQIPWVDWERDSLYKGFMYCCEVDDLNKAISYSPVLDASLLTDMEYSMNICHDEKVYGTIWTHHTIRGESINNRDRTIDRPTFRTNIGRSKIYYPFTTMTQMNSQYSKSTQVKTIETLFGNNSIIVDGKEIPIIDESRSGTNYFAKGHLSPDAAFIYSVEQDGTYFYFNTAPQFHSFNNRNWKSIESTARKWTSDNKRNLEVYTGTASILNLLNEQCKPINIELFSDRQYVPAPMYYWKVLYDPEANEAIAFIGLNNPYERKAHNHICTNICAQTVFDDVDFYKFEAGYTMCCEVSQLRMSISSIPDLSKEGKWPELMGKLGPTPPPPTRNGCKILLDKLPEKNTPLITSNGSFLYPTYIKDDARITLVPQGSTVELNCHRSRGNFLLYKEERVSKIKSVKLTCTNDKLYTEGMEVNPADYKCSSKNQPSLIITRNSKCSPEGIDKRKTDLERITHISLGWNFRSGFIEQVEICIDELFYGTLWTKHYVEGQNIEMRDKYSGRPAFIVDETGKKKIVWKTINEPNNKVRAYAKNSQNTSIYDQSIMNPSKSSKFYLAKGHLSPDSAFVYDGEQEGTYFFVNVAPQYQSFNKGNWKALEYAVRDLAKNQYSKLTVYTGTYEILELHQKQIFLLEKKFIPVPRYFWKVLHDPARKKAVAFVGYNNVLRKTSPKPICTDVCDQIPWVDWERESLFKGYMYCCKVEDLNKAISYSPDLDASLLIDMEYSHNTK
nr:uncharacterized protein LOC121119415 [Lepeophtheirus salmonis]